MKKTKLDWQKKIKFKLQHAKKSQKVPVKNKTVEKSKKCKKVFSQELFTFYEDKKHGKKIDEKNWPKTFAYFLHNWDRGGGAAISKLSHRDKI